MSTPVDDNGAPQRLDEGQRAQLAGALAEWVSFALRRRLASIRRGIRK